jgi:glutamate racemase
LWCTHFSVYKKYFSEIFKGKIIDPSLISAHKFGKYLENHPEIKNNLSQNGTISFYTTWNTQNFNNIWSNIWWSSINSKNI